MFLEERYTSEERTNLSKSLFNFLNFFIWFDGVSTFILVRFHGIEGEMNPLLRNLFVSFGTFNTLLITRIGWVLFMNWLFKVAEKDDPMFLLSLILSSLFSLLVILTNSISLIDIFF